MVLLFLFEKWGFWELERKAKGLSGEEARQDAQLHAEFEAFLDMTAWLHVVKLGRQRMWRTILVRKDG